MIEWEIKEHPEFFRDLDKIGVKDLQIFFNKKKKIKEHPLRQKHLRGGENCYREPITENIRLVYYIEKRTIWLLSMGKHKEIYKKYIKRLHSLRK